MGRRLVTRLIVPLLAITVISLFIARPLNRTDLFTNLATELISIVITVGYVSWVISSREHESRKPVDALVQSLAAQRAYMILQTIFLHLNLPADYSKIDTYTRLRQHVIERTSTSGIDSLAQSLLTTHANRLEALARFLTDNRVEIISLYDLYSNRLDERIKLRIIEVSQGLRDLESNLELLAETTRWSARQKSEGDTIESKPSMTRMDDAARCAFLIHQVAQGCSEIATNP